MDNALAVRRVERVQDFASGFQRFPERHRPMERLAIDVFHDEVVRPHVVDRADVRMIQCGDG